MKSPAPLLLLGLLLAFGRPLGAAEEPMLAVVAPPDAFAPGLAWQVDLIAFNPSTTTAYYEPPVALAAQAAIAGQLAPVEFVATTSGKLTIPPGSFGVRRYAAAHPPGGTGLIALEFRAGLPAPSRTALVVDARAVPAPVAPSPITSLARLATSESAVERAFASRFGLHEPIYFIYGPDAPAAKFQISFKYRLLQFAQSEGEEPFTHSLQLGYTQRSLWDIGATSSPFYDTSYMPELMLQSVAPLPRDPDRWFTLLGTQAFLKHESNGRDGPDSRSLNTVGVRAALALGALDRWHLIVLPEVFTYLTSLEDNPDLKDYRGYGRLRLVLEKNNRRPALTYSFQAGKDFSHPTHQVDLTFPFRTRWLEIETSLLLQYFNGYGESLRDYQTRSETLRAGLSLVR